MVQLTSDTVQYIVHSANHLSSCRKRPGPEVIKLFSCSTQLSMNFKVLIHTETAKINGNFRFKSQKLVIYPADKC